MPTSNSGFRAPSAILKAEFGLEAKSDFEPVFSGKHDNSILGVVNKDYEAAAVANSVLSRMIDRKVFEPAKIRSIYKSETFPTTGYGYAYNLDPKLVEKIKEAFFNFPWEGSALAAEFKKEGKFMPIDYKKDWAVLRRSTRRPASNTLANRQVSGGGASCFASRGWSSATGPATWRSRASTSTVPDGQVMALIGPSGAGKSTRHPLHQPAGRADRRHGHAQRHRNHHARPQRAAQRAPAHGHDLPGIRAGRAADA